MNSITLKSEYLKLHSKFFTLTAPTSLVSPKLLSYNLALAKELGFTKEMLDSDEFVEFVNGSFVTNGSTTYASAYSGHQFGYFVPNLGDGRALNLGSLNGYHLQLKGSGQTPYSRNGDGRAVIRSSIREYLVSEAIHALGIATTRALAIISSDTQVYRERIERGSIVLRASSSWVRFGTFEYAYLGHDKVTHVKQLADFVIEQSYPYVGECEHKYEELYFAIVDKTVELMAQWQSVGFMHGVMNTDNMSIAGLTIDYGPFAFMERFDKKSICNLSDYDGRYSFENQPYIAQWNLLVLAKAFSLIADEKLLESYADIFIGKFKKCYMELMLKKLGLTTSHESELVAELLKTLQICNIEYTPFFYYLSLGNFDEVLKMSEKTELKEWLESYKRSLELEERPYHEILFNMRRVNPKYVLKNYMLQNAIDKAEEGDFTLVNELLKIAQNPYDEHEEFEHYAHKSCEEMNSKMCSCSS